jgi:beta-lactamase regulating signal transducer with metallopeptidase domain
LVWCAVQVTLFGLLAGAMYLICRRWQPASGTSVTVAGLASILVLTVMALSPWPRWSFGDRGGATAQSASARPAPRDDSHVAPSEAAVLPAEVGPVEEATVEGPAFGALFLEALADGLSGETARPEASHWRWPAAAGVLFVVAAGLGAVWLVAGLVSVRAYRAGSRAIADASLLELVDVLRAKLGCRRRIELRQSDTLPAAATIGWRRPIVILPADWTAWTADQRRAVLAHEIAHVRDGHFLGVLCGQLGLMLHFYHPLVHWLVHRLRLEQELAADAAAAGVIGGERRYLETIAELALGQSDRPLVWPARSFLPTRNTFLRRIAMLRDARPRSMRGTTGTRLLAIGSVLLCAVLVAGLRGPSAAEQVRAAAGEAAEPADEAPKAAESATRQEIDLTHVPADTRAMIVLRPASFLAHPELAELRLLLREPMDPFADFGLPAAAIEQVAWVWQGGELPPTRVRPSPLELGTFVVQAGRPQEFHEFLGLRVDDRSPGEFRGKRYQTGSYPAAMPEITVAYYRPDQSTAVLALKDDLHRLLAGPSGRLPEFLDADTWARFRDDQLVVAVDASAIETLVQSEEFRQPRPAVAPFAPLWEEGHALVLGIRLGDRFRAQVQVLGKDEAGAEKIEETLQAARVLARNFSDQMRQQLPEQDDRPDGADRILLGILELLVGHVRIEREGLVVRASCSVDVETARLGMVAAAVKSAQEAAQRAQANLKLKQLGMAMHVYHDTHKRLPPAVLYEPDGKTPHSWRVALLPYLGQRDLYEQYRLDEPWDGPNNRKLLGKIPAVYRSPKGAPDSTSSSVFVLTGPGTVFDDEEGTRFSEIKDGTSNTLLIVEAARDVPWTKPEDIPFDPEKPLPKLGGFFEGGFHAVRVDGSILFVSDLIDEQMLRSAILKADGQRIVWPWFDDRRRAPGRQRPSSTTDKLRRIGLAMHNYYDQHKCLPPAVLHHSEGSPPYSWRVELLPNLGGEEYEIYKQYRFDEPWDGPNNRKLLDKIPAVYRSTKGPPGSSNASVFVLTGPGTVFDDEEGTSFRDIHDGTSNTILAVEARREIPWTKPEDIPYDSTKPVPELGGADERGFYAILCDGSVHLIRRSVREDVLRALIGKSDGQHIEGRY